MNEKPPTHTGSIWTFLRREPLLHFLAAAALLFVANAVFSGDEREVITVDHATQEYLIQQRQDLLLRPLSELEQTDIIESFIEEEILAREARKRGFDNSSRIRTMLVQNMRFFLNQELPQPSEEELQAFFEAHPERFNIEARISYDHVFFSDPENVPADALERLRAGASHTAMGERGLFAPAQLREFGQTAIAGSFGPNVAREVLAIDDSDWHGPFESPQGVHFLRVAERHAPRQLEFADIVNWVESDWIVYKSRENIDLALAEMRKNYRIEIATVDEATE